MTTEIHNVYRGFNQMLEQLSKVEADRTVMLAGISHDIRTPLARLRLETELSVADSEARHAMANDIEQINNIIGKFLDYARPNHAELKRVHLAPLIEQTMKSALGSANETQDLVIEASIPPDLSVWADPVELQRVLTNLIENARRYGKSAVKMTEFSDLVKLRKAQAQETTIDDGWPATVLYEEGLELAHVKITARLDQDWVVIALRDHGDGVPPHLLTDIKTPFFRANNARSDVTGTGLGLAIVEKTVQAMQGEMHLSNIDARTESKLNQSLGILAPYSGFLAEIRLKQA